MSDDSSKTGEKDHGRSSGLYREEKSFTKKTGKPPFEGIEQKDAQPPFPTKIAKNIGRTDIATPKLSNVQTAASCRQKSEGRRSQKISYCGGKEVTHGSSISS